MSDFDYADLEPEVMTDEREPLASDTFDVPEQPVDYPNPDFVSKPRPSRTAKQYADKSRSALNFAFRATVDKPGTVADAAALLQYGEDLSVAVGDLAVQDARVAKMLDFLDGGTSSPYGAVAIAALPLVTQLIRNHEPVLEPAHRGFKIPFTKRFVKVPFKVGIRLGGIRAMTHDPSFFTQSVFSDDKVKAKLAKEGINVARYKS